MVLTMLNIAIIGTGAISGTHIKGYLKFPKRCKITALVDINPDKARKKADEYGLNVDIHDNHVEALKHSNIDLVSLCLPPFVHAPVTIECLQAGKHILVEKPMAPSLKECDDMINAARNNKKLLSVVAQNRFTNDMMKLKQILDGGHIGKDHLIFCANFFCKICRWNFESYKIGVVAFG